VPAAEAPAVPAADGTRVDNRAKAILREYLSRRF